MQSVTCSHCNGSGKMRRGELIEGIDWNFNFSQGFANMCSTQEVKDGYRDRCIEFLRTLKPGDKFVSYQHEKTALRVGMYDGWPYWAPTPAVSYMGPLGLEYAFYNNISAPYRRSESATTDDAVART